MSHENVGKLMDRWMNDREFRQHLRADPEKAVAESGVSLTAEEFSALKSFDWTKSDQQLVSLISKPTL